MRPPLPSPTGPPPVQDAERADEDFWRHGLAVLAEHLPLGVFVTTRSGRPLYVSDRCAALVGAARGDDGRWDWEQRLHPDDRERVVASWTGSLGPARAGFDETFRVQDGPGHRWLRARADRLVQHGEVQVLIGTVEDVSDVRELRGRATDRELMLDAVLNGSSDLVAVIDEHLRFSFVSEGAQRVLGREPSDWIGGDAFALLHPEDVGRAAEHVLAAIEAGPGQRPAIGARLLHADGTWRQVDLVANNLLHVEHVRGLVVTARDVSERVRAEASIAAATSRFEQAFDRAPIGMALIANDGRLLRSNDALARMVGRSVQELAGRSLIRLAHPDDRAEALARAEAVLLRDDPDAVELRFVRPDGDTAWVRVTATVIRDESGTPQHTIAHLEDVTEQRTVRAQLERAAAHDPLTGLLNRAGFAQRFEAATGDDRRPGALLQVDLDGFKAVNDEHGHAAGDELLEHIARRLLAVVRTTDAVGRLGGDEFAIHQPDVGDAASVLSLGERVRSTLAQPFHISAGTVHVSGSIGVAMLDGQVALSKALAAADASSYAAKRHGGNRVELTWCTELGLATPAG